SRPRLSRRRRIRRRCSSALLLRQIGPRSQSCRRRHGRRAVQSANEILATDKSPRSARPSQCRARYLVENGFMTEGQVYGARRNPATPIDRAIEDAPNYYLDWAFDEMRKLVDTLPKSVTSRSFTVRTALDGNLQHYAEREAESVLRQYGRDYGASQVAVVVGDLDGGVRAMVGGRDYGASQFNRATDALRQPGSSFKPYVYATALANGFKPTSVVADSPVCIGNWCPHNYSGGYSGQVTLLEAITHSINVIPVKLSIMLGNGNPKLGRALIVQTARNFGIHSPLPDTPSLPIGADEVYVYEHAMA